MSAGHSHHGHDHAHHDHAHGSGPHTHGPGGHSHAPSTFGRTFAIGITLNVGFVAIEAAYGYISGSLALFADAGHNLSDVLGLVIAWIAFTLGRRAPSQRFTYGLRGSTILAALFNGLILMFAAGAIAIEAARRFMYPLPVSGTDVMIVAGIGIIVNGGTALLFARGGKSDINIRGAYLHMAADAMVSAGVVVAGLLINATGLRWIDPAVSLVIVGVIVWSTWGLLKEAIAMALHAVPASIDAVAVQAWLAALPGVTAVHDLHIWPMSTSETALTAHLIMPGGQGDDHFLFETSAALHERFAIGHATLQIERTDALCPRCGDNVV
ncbi:cation diffusion facilitator family transporter [Sphingobium sp. CR28]|uniref:cation diffusion facilitator family transporter n=1 Tax=Sphingobium sp. CR28 TaxID=3400272 RepID=UPI003FEDF2E8